MLSRNIPETPQVYLKSEGLISQAVLSKQSAKQPLRDQGCLPLQPRSTARWLLPSLPPTTAQLSCVLKLGASCARWPWLSLVHLWQKAEGRRIQLSALKSIHLRVKTELPQQHGHWSDFRLIPAQMLLPCSLLAALHTPHHVILINQIVCFLRTGEILFIPIAPRSLQDAQRVIFQLIPISTFFWKGIQKLVNICFEERFQELYMEEERRENFTFHLILYTLSEFLPHGYINVFITRCSLSVLFTWYTLSVL